MHVIIDGVEYAPVVRFTPEKLFTVAQALRAARRNSGLSLQEAARMSGASKSYIWEIKQGHSEPSFKKVASLCRIYGVDIRYLTEAVEMSHVTER